MPHSNSENIRNSSRNISSLEEEQMADLNETSICSDFVVVFSNPERKMIWSSSFIKSSFE